MTEEEKKTSVQCSKITKKSRFYIHWQLRACISGEKSQSQNSIQHFEFSRTFLALLVRPAIAGLSVLKKVWENSKCCIEF